MEITKTGKRIQELIEKPVSSLTLTEIKFIKIQAKTKKDTRCIELLKQLESGSEEVIGFIPHGTQETRELKYSSNREFLKTLGHVNSVLDAYCGKRAGGKLRVE